MSHELYYTSAPRGLQPGSRGFCTVASTEGVPAHLAEQIESLSAYRPLFPPLDARAKLNPIVYSHLRVTAGSKTYNVLSRIGPAGLDYSQRSNKFAHHVILESGELPPGGPAWLLAQPGFLEDQWDGEVRHIPAGRIPPQGDAAPSVCRHWKNLTGDAGWAGVLADSFEKDPIRQVYLVFSPGTDVLPVVVESLRLLPPPKRWLVTFSTYFTNLPQGIPCLWRFVAKGSPEAANANRLPGAMVINLTEPLGKPAESELVEQARTGRGPAKSVSRLQGVGASSHWPNDFERTNQGYSLLETGERHPANAKAPPPPAAPRRPATQSAKLKRAWIWAALIGLIFGLASGALASFLISSSSEHLTSQAIAELEKERDEATSQKHKADRELAALKKATDLEKETSKQAIATWPWDMDQTIDNLKKQRDQAISQKSKADQDIASLQEKNRTAESATKKADDAVKGKNKEVEKLRGLLTKAQDENNKLKTAHKNKLRRVNKYFLLPNYITTPRGADPRPVEIDLGHRIDPRKVKMALAGIDPRLDYKEDTSASLIVKVKGKEGDRDLAKFNIADNGKLSFQWINPNRQELIEPQRLLRECVLVVDDTHVALRNPTKLEKWQDPFKDNRIKDFFSDPTQGCPSRTLFVDSIVVDVEGLDTFSKHEEGSHRNPLPMTIVVEKPYSVHAKESSEQGTIRRLIVDQAQTQKQDRFEASYESVASLKIESPDVKPRSLPKVTIRSLVLYMEVAGFYVEVARIGNGGE